MADKDYTPYQENARRWYKKVQEECTFVNHAIVNPPVDRNKELSEVRDVYMHVEKETDGGLIVSGVFLLINKYHDSLPAISRTWKS